MRKALAALVAAGVSASIVGCGSGTQTEPTPSAAETPRAETTSAETTSGTARPNISGPNQTINDYITENNIAETPIKPDEPGTPDFDFPYPPDWSDAGDRTPAWAYGAIVYDKPADPADPPTMLAIASKLTGNVDPAKVLEYAPGMMRNLPDFKSLMDPEKSTLGGFEAVQEAGTYIHEGKPRVVAQKTVIIPGSDGLYVLQLNAVAPEAEQDVIVDAAKLINEQTKITP